MIYNRVSQQIRYLRWIFPKTPKTPRPEKKPQKTEPTEPPKPVDPSEPRIVPTALPLPEAREEQKEKLLIKKTSAVCKFPKYEETCFLEDKNVIYVGGFGTINFECCKLLASAGIKHLSILELSKDICLFRDLQKLNPNVHFMLLDLCDGQKAIARAVKKAWKRMGHIDVVINGSDIINERNPKHSIRNNLLGLIHTNLVATKYMSRNEGGRGGLIVNVASIFGLEPAACIAVYSATQHGVIGFTRACAHNHYFKHTGIGHMALCVGFTETERFRNIKGANTFAYSQPISEEILGMKRQTVAKCAEHMTRAIQNAENGSVWMINYNRLEKVQMQTHWKGQFENEKSLPVETVPKVVKDFVH